MVESELSENKALMEAEKACLLVVRGVHLAEKSIWRAWIDIYKAHGARYRMHSKR
jgi:hypothetical protein